MRIISVLFCVVFCTGCALLAGHGTTAQTQAVSEVGNVAGAISAASPGTPWGLIGSLVAAVSVGILAHQKVTVPLLTKLINFVTPDSFSTTSQVTSHTNGGSTSTATSSTTPFKS